MKLLTTKTKPPGDWQCIASSTLETAHNTPKADRSLYREHADTPGGVGIFNKRFDCKM